MSVLFVDDVTGKPFRDELMEQQTWRLVKLLTSAPVSVVMGGNRADPQYQAVLYTHILVSTRALIDS